MIIFAINLDVKKEDKKIDQLKSPLINQNIPKNPIRLFQKNDKLIDKMENDSF